jgi:uncharacterized SAM-binding protein YcdF (DUF218 family)
MRDTAHHFVPQWLLSKLTQSDKPDIADAIFVLAGGQERKNFGLELFRQGLAPRILLSVGRFEIRRFAPLVQCRSVDLLRIAADIPPPQRHFFVDFHGTETEVRWIRPRLPGTLCEMKAFRKWLGENGDVTSVLIVSSAMHLRRLRACALALFPREVNLRFSAVPTGFTAGASHGAAEAETPSWRPILLECLKLAIYRTMLDTRLSGLNRLVGLGQS